MLLVAALAAAGGQWVLARSESIDALAVVLLVLVFPLTWAYAYLEPRSPELKDDAPPISAGTEPVLTRTRLAAVQHRTFLGTLSLFALAGCVVLAGDEGHNAAKIALLLVAIVLFLAACRPEGWRRALAASVSGLRAHGLEVFGVVAILAVAAFVRLYHLDTYPFGMHGDEGEFGSAALRLMDGDSLEIFSSAVFLQHPNVYAFLLAGTMQLFGDDFAGARVLSGVAGTLTVLGVYALTRTLFASRVAVVAAAFFALAPWHLTFSRMAMNDVLVPLFLTATILFLYRGLLSQSAWDYALAGVSCGLGWWADYNNKSVILCLVVGAVALYLTAIDWRRRHAHLVLLALFATGVLVVMAPVLTAALKHEQLLRFTEVARESSFALHLPPSDEPARGSPLLVAANKVARTVFAFNYFGDASPFNAGNATPVLDGITAVFFFVGLAYGLWRWRDPRYGVLVLWWAVALAPDIWALDSPQGHHLFPAIVPAYVLAAVGLTKVAQAWAAGLRWSRPAYLYAITGIVIAIVSYVNVTRYFFPPSVDRSWEYYVEAGRAIRRLAPTHAVYFLGPPEVVSAHGAIRFTSHDTPVTDVENVRDVVPLRQPSALDLYFLFTRAHFEDLEYVRRTYPQGSLTEWRDHGGAPFMIGYEVSHDVSRQSAVGSGQ